MFWSNSMKSKIAIFGSCVSIDAFRSFYNKDYKKHFELENVQTRISFISLFQDKIDYNPKSIQILPDNPTTRFSTKVIKNELEKNFFNNLNDSEYLIIDLFFEIYFGIIYTEYGILTNNIWDYPQTKFYNDLKKKDAFNIKINSHQYYELWTRYCDKFFEYMQNNYPDIKIILNKIKIVNKVKDRKGNYYIEDKYTQIAKDLNPIITIFEEYIESNYDVIVINLTNNIYTEEEHIWGKNIVHYNREYYELFEKTILKITSKNNFKYYYNEKNKVNCSKRKKEVEKKYIYKLRKYRNKHIHINKIINKTKKILK